MKIIRRQSRGFTLLELLVVMSTVALLAGGGLHAWVGYQQALRLEQGARQLLDFLNRVQARAYWRNETHTVRLIQQGEYWCMDSDTEGERHVSGCSGCCDDHGQQFTRAVKDLAVTQSTGDAFTFYGLRNAARAGHITLTNAAGRVRLVISVRGRMRLCSEAPQILAIPLC
ncbi:prepilin peptidase-dependent protein [Brenneria goodwinii]|uniref:prepilin peptidase-dependent protein n=1 Tax=Brenneria goodwinii TaxID=1109412 RepID=UPI000EF1C20A|nr:prepilin peptidase-dependent protein [Brenneria goodwinii]MCG8155460.1 prepilin peptidase-dependent protein [Brenneria goodwinii]MCG8161660.1 prepilin peptidase-dependent protein [Brenneria goodwinii]MCG8165993.1 prepilin peptidase-dependent protein [Brenneria goodwinii]MCG8169307.1 prepilin peptidase-dependent protein [Brenneria goodwinii]MCG8175688.1 prepilin peptidase-dependent protein [Brenneria goodwinii]